MNQASFRTKDIAMEDPRLKAASAFGGILFRKARYRTHRPLCTKRSIHLVLRSSQTTGKRSFQSSENWKRIEKLCFEFAARHRIQIQHYANGGNHLHLVIKLKRKLAYASFIRALTGAIALKVTGANRNQANKTRFWDFRPFTTLVERSTKYSIAKDYVTLNFLENLKVIPAVRARLKGIRAQASALNTS
ncbi:transposase [Bdellovibrio svalbardensis]|uniref:Transposase n=1 Tax=Bdellovibrio svalbardensis TaxID=2972972 RepID=A0ABT6DLN9_9BACT|nr:transposase [Bdellovibrio svalbardensis]MDG0817799.1 transposase [Bdellovibrio svalbardensis]